MHRALSLGSVLCLTLWTAGAALGGVTPLAVSPGDTSTVAPIEGRCPTFSWSTVVGAASYELVVYRLGAEGEPAERALRRRLAGSISSWTPTLEHCLERGGRYAWLVRARATDGVTEWSQPALFAVPAGPSQLELEAAHALVEESLSARRASSVDTPRADRDREETIGERSSDESFAPERADVAQPATAAATAFSVDGGVVATSFTGDGSTLTGVDAQTLQGTVPGDFANAGHGHVAGEITSGELDDARIPAGIARVGHGHAAGEITSGELDDARIPAGIARDSEVEAGYLHLTGGTLSGGLVVQPQDLNLPAGFLSRDDVVIESTDAVLGIYSDMAGDNGSAIVLGETPALSVFGTDKWTILRETHFGGKDLRITYGTDPDYWRNPTMLELRNDGSFSIPGKFDVSQTGRISGAGIPEIVAKVGINGEIVSGFGIERVDIPSVGHYELVAEEGLISCGDTGTSPQVVVATSVTSERTIAAGAVCTDTKDYISVIVHRLSFGDFVPAAAGFSVVMY